MEVKEKDIISQKPSSHLSVDRESDCRASRDTREVIGRRVGADMMNSGTKKYKIRLIKESSHGVMDVTSVTSRNRCIRFTIQTYVK